MRGGPTQETALVLRSLKLGDTSKIVTVLTPTYGRAKLVAKGVRKLGSRLGSLLEPGNQLEVVVYANPGRDLWLLKEASLERAALTGGTTLDKLSHLFAALELADRLLPEQQPLPELENVYRVYLDRWHAADSGAMPALFFALELSLLEHLGLAMDVAHCGSCGEPILEHGRAVHVVADGAMACERCAREGGHWVDADALVCVDTLAQGLATGTLPPVNASRRRVIGRLLHEHMTFHLPNYRVPRSLYWLTDERRTSEG